MQNNSHFSPAEAREAARELLAELPLTEDRRASMDDFWIGRLRTALADLLGAEPMTLGDCGDMIRQALAVRARLLGELDAALGPDAPYNMPVVITGPLCDSKAANEGGGEWLCVRPAGHEGRHEAGGASPPPVWEDGGEVGFLAGDAR